MIPNLFPEPEKGAGAADPVDDRCPPLPPSLFTGALPVSAGGIRQETILPNPANLLTNPGIDLFSRRWTNISGGMVRILILAYHHLHELLH